MPVHYELGKRSDAPNVVLITLDRPETKNACDLEHFHQLAQAWKRFAADDDAWVAIFTGVGRAFMSGADLKTYVPEITKLAKQIQDGTATESKGYSLSDGTDAVLRGSKIYKPIIAAVNGPCVAGGMEMLGGVDIRVASEHATFGVLEPARGLFAGGGTTVRLPRQVPFAHAMEFLLCADVIDAAAGRRHGPAQRRGARGRAAGRGLLLRRPHHQERAAGHSGHQTQCAGRAGARHARGVPERVPHLPRDLRDRGCQGGAAGLRGEAPSAVVRVLMGSTDDSRRLCVIGAAQHTVRDGDAPEPLVSWEQRAREAAAGRRAGRCSAAN